LEKKTEQVLPGSEGGGEEREEVGAGERNDPNNVCTSEYLNKEKKIFFSLLLFVFPSTIHSHPHTQADLKKIIL
jgi:hypothetical protein